MKISIKRYNNQL